MLQCKEQTSLVRDEAGSAWCSVRQNKPWKRKVLKVRAATPPPLPLLYRLLAVLGWQWCIEWRRSRQGRPCPDGRQGGAEGGRLRGERAVTAPPLPQTAALPPCRYVVGVHGERKGC